MSVLSVWQGRTVEAWRQAWGVPTLEIHDRIGSTNDRALALAREGAPHGSTVVADVQTAGRGRTGARWLSVPGGSVLLSVILRTRPDEATNLTLLMGLACAEALERCSPGLQVGLKWPNDLILEGGKLGGVLCEAVSSATGGSGIVVGVGVNLEAPPPNAVAASDFPPVGLAAGFAGPPEPGTLAGGLVQAILTAGVWAGQPIPEPLLASYAMRDVLRGRRVATAAGVGTAAGIDPSGALLLRREDGTEARVQAGSVRLA